MRFAPLMRAASVTALLFGAYLLVYGAFCLWQHHGTLLPEAAEPDAHGMSRLVGYSFILMLGVLVCGVGVLTWLVRGVAEAEARDAVTLGLLILNSLASLLSLVLQYTLWGTQWGKLYVAAFLLQAVAFGYYRVSRRRIVSEGAV